VLLGEVLQRLGFTSTEEINACVSDLAWHNEPAHFDWNYHPSVTSPLKRAMDIAGALVGLGITVSILPGVSLAVFLEDGGPVFFKQYRVGLHGWQFPIFKFRTMVPDADRFKLSVKSDNALFFSTKHDRRITRVGRVLRKTMIDELPQFWNVLSGQMSLVGTRPPTLDEVSHYTREHFRRLEVKPGLTGLWQASGGRHEKSFDDVLALDLEYQRTWSLLLDVKIIAKTVYLAMLKAGKS
jgi:lipopolysaccharide/colanic/teichoic acid biosynthesis glycosyltransferase